MQITNQPTTFNRQLAPRQADQIDALVLEQPGAWRSSAVDKTPASAWTRPSPSENENCFDRSGHGSSASYTEMVEASINSVSSSIDAMRIAPPVKTLASGGESIG